MSDLKASYQVMLRLEGELNLDRISADLGLTPTKTVHKGELVHSALAPSEADVWVLSVDAEDDWRDPLERLLDLLLPIRNILLERYGNQYSIRISCHSELAQIGMTIPLTIVQRIAESGASLEISVFSWGKVLDE